MAQSTDDPGGKRPRPEPGYEVLPDEEEEERYGPEVRRRLRRQGRRAKPEPGGAATPDDEPHDGEYRRRSWGNQEDDDPAPRRQRSRFPRSVDLLGVACAFAVLPTALLAMGSAVLLVVHRGKFLLGVLALFLALTGFYAQIAWGVFRRRASGLLLLRCGIGSIGTGALLGAIIWPMAVSRIQDEHLTNVGRLVWGGAALLFGWMVLIGLMALVARLQLQMWRANRRGRY